MSARKIPTTHIRIPRNDGEHSLRAIVEMLDGDGTTGEKIFRTLKAAVLAPKTEVGSIIDNPLRDGYATRQIRHPDGRVETQHLQVVDSHF